MLKVNLCKTQPLFFFFFKYGFEKLTLSEPLAAMLKSSLKIRQSRSVISGRSFIFQWRSLSASLSSLSTRRCWFFLERIANSIDHQIRLDFINAKRMPALNFLQCCGAFTGNLWGKSRKKQGCSWSLR